jgi:hypothetical protein
MRTFFLIVILSTQISISSFAGGKLGLGIFNNWEKVTSWKYDEKRGQLNYVKNRVFPTYVRFGLKGSINYEKLSFELGISYYKEVLKEVSYTGCVNCGGVPKDLYYHNLSFPITVTYSFSKNYNSTVFGQLGMEMIYTTYTRKDSYIYGIRSTSVSEKFTFNRRPLHFGLGYKFRIIDDIYSLIGFNLNFINIGYNSDLNEQIETERVVLCFELKKEF